MGGSSRHGWGDRGKALGSEGDWIEFVADFDKRRYRGDLAPMAGAVIVGGDGEALRAASESEFIASGVWWGGRGVVQNSHFSFLIAG